MNKFKSNRYCGEYFDNETESIYLRARNYNPSTGRFTSEDPFWTVDNMIYGDKVEKTSDIKSIMQSNNMYVYCINNPLNNIDYTGKFAFAIPIAGEISAEALTAIVTGLGYIGSKIIDGVLYIFEDDSKVSSENCSEIINKTIDIINAAIGKSGNNSQNKINKKGVAGKGWRGDKTWKGNVNKVKDGGTIKDLNGDIPTEEEAKDLINESGGKINRVDEPHPAPNPHNYKHINYTTPTGLKGTIRIK